MSLEKITWKIYAFEDLTPHLLYEILKLRQEIFIIEQECIYPDIDGADQNCYHLCGFLDESLAALLRVVPPGLNREEPALGRISVREKFRGKGAGKMLIRKGIETARQQFGDRPIRIEAQTYLDSFYKSLGFHPVGEPYDLDGIEHIQMVLS